jgi:ribosomal protein S21
MEKIVTEVKEKIRRGEKPTQEDAIKVFEAVKEAFRKTYNL